MNLSTLIELCRPGDLAEWVYGEDDQDDPAHPDRIEKDVLKQYELIDEDAVFDGSISSSNGVDNSFVFRNKQTGTLYRVTTPHDSWCDYLPEAFDGAKIEIVQPKKVVIDTYEKIGTADLIEL
jgi:hypothetical protein